MRRDVVQAYIEKLLATITESDHVAPDQDGDYPVRFGSALYFVRLVGDDHPDVQVFAVAVDGVQPTAELLAEINEINSRARFARVFHVRDQVLVETDLVGDALEPQVFSNACDVVARITDQVGPELVRNHGGRTAFDDGKDSRYVPQGGPVGMYL